MENDNNVLSEYWRIETPPPFLYSASSATRGLHEDGGKLYLGEQSSTSSFKLHIYDFNENTWSYKNLSGKIIWFIPNNGIMYAYVQESAGVFSFKQYNIENEIWINSLPFPYGITLSPVIYDDKIYTISSNGTTRPPLYIYDINSATWSSVNSPLTQKRYVLAITDNKLYAVEIHQSGSDSSKAANGAEYDLRTGTWRTLTNMPRNAMPWSIVAYDKKVYLLGCGLHSGRDFEVFMYDIDTDSFVQQQSMIRGFTMANATLYDSRIYCGGMLPKDSFLISRSAGSTSPRKKIYILTETYDDANVIASYTTDNITTIDRQSVKTLLQQP